MHKKIVFSFKYASEGIWVALREEHNLFIQFLIGAVGLILGVLFHITKTDWLIGILTWGIECSMELTNTAIEEIIDSFVTQYHPGAKKAKDIAAAAVMTMFIIEAVVGLIIFLPYILKSFS